MTIAKEIFELAPYIENKVHFESIKQFLLNFDKQLFVNGQKIFITEDLSVAFIEKECLQDDEPLLEAHRNYVDLHHVLSGRDLIWLKEVSRCKNIKKEYDGQHDYILYNELPDNKITLQDEEFCLIDTDTAHMALKGNGIVRKMVFKIPR
jgi:biofilm protein TabA